MKADPANLVLLSNFQAPSGYWTVLNVGVPWIECCDPEEMRRILSDDYGMTTILFDLDGNGTMRQIPVEWIGDGERIEGSERALALIEEADNA
jgi:hypothetical protein